MECDIRIIPFTCVFPIACHRSRIHSYVVYYIFCLSPSLSIILPEYEYLTNIIAANKVHILYKYKYFESSGLHVYIYIVCISDTRAPPQNVYFINGSTTSRIIMFRLVIWFVVVAVFLLINKHQP